MDSIRDIIPHVIEGLSTKKPNSGFNISEIWQKIARDGSQHTTVVDYKKGMLTIHVDSSAWLYQLSMQKNILLEELKKEIPDVTNIYFKVGKIH